VEQRIEVQSGPHSKTHKPVDDWRQAMITTQRVLQDGGDLAQHQLIRLTTFRQSGRPVSVPVTYALHDGRIYVVTGAKTGKIKRLRHCARVEIAPCDSRGDPLGPVLIGQARILPTEEARQLKPNLRFQIGNGPMFLFNLRRDLVLGGNLYLEITLQA
jgi:PPOX class probable F420-dependent enzyme